jgi:hypothetical protein
MLARTELKSIAGTNDIDKSISFLNKNFHRFSQVIDKSGDIVALGDDNSWVLLRKAYGPSIESGFGIIQAGEVFNLHITPSDKVGNNLESAARLEILSREPRCIMVGDTETLTMPLLWKSLEKQSIWTRNDLSPADFHMAYTNNLAEIACLGKDDYDEFVELIAVKYYNATNKPLPFLDHESAYYHSTTFEPPFGVSAPVKE